MDKNTIIGVVIIFLILMGFNYMNRPSEEQVREKFRQDSIARVEAERMRAEKEALQAEIQTTPQDSISAENVVFKQDSVQKDVIVLENENVKVSINTLGARIEQVEMRGYTTADSMPLLLWTPDKSTFGLKFFALNKKIETQQYYFTPDSVYVAADSSQKVVLRLYVEQDKFLEFAYTLAPHSYMVDFNVRTYNLGSIISANTNYLSLNWAVEMPQLERDKDYENRYTNVYYDYLSNEVDYLSATGNVEESMTNKLRWVAFKQQFFSSVLMAGDSFESSILGSQENNTPGYLKTAYADLQLPYEGKGIESYDLKFYFIPNSFTILNEYDKNFQLTELVNLGWSWVSWFNRWIVIPLFNILEKVTNSYGLIILLLTLIIKCCLFPLTYKSYISQAKMRVLKPQIDEINAKIPSSKAMERQQATMALYKKAGINPMGGCLPMLLQMPILLALYQFFPSAIELRQESFLWAVDLASYDSIWNMPFSIPFYGNHVSLFCLLMTVTNVVYTYMNQKNQPMNDQMKSMRIMMYMMPIMFLFIFNNIAAALSYYYFISTLITIIQTWLIRMKVDDKKLLKQIEMAKAKPVKKSKFQMRLEQMQKMQEQKLKDRQRK